MPVLPPELWDLGTGNAPGRLRPEPALSPGVVPQGAEKIDAAERRPVRAHEG
jgi:hypothetical protein